MITFLGLETVPILQRDFKMINDIPKLIDLSNGKSKLANIQREGLVYVFNNDIKDVFVERISFKVISNKYLLKHEE